jgi:RNA polymerase sigma-70 factor (ECF subfamily)
MARLSRSATRITLLRRLQRDPNDPAAWSEFVQHYGRKILGWCRSWNLQEADARDVTQEVLLKLAGKMRDFVYDPSRSFRGWLKTITRHAYRDFLDGRPLADRGSGDSDIFQALHTTEARDDLVQSLEEEFDRELLEIAMARVQLRVAGRTWDAFRLLAFEGLSGVQAAEQLGMKVATVYVARSKVQKMLQQEVQRLETAAVEGES